MAKDELSFDYFPENYRWSHGMLLPLGAAPRGGGEIGEIHRVGLKLRERMGDDRAKSAKRIPRTPKADRSSVVPDSSHRHV
jgi:hypothetical protein